jgi:hypothetical protein
MFTFTSEFFFGIFIGFALGLWFNVVLCNGRPNNTGALIQTMKLQSITKLSVANKIYSPDIEKLWNNLKRLYDKRIKLDPKFSFNKVAFEIYKLLKEKAVTASTIRNFYLRRTTPRKKTIEVIQRWIDEEKENVNHSDGDDENKEIDDSDNVINSSNNKKDNKI